MDIRDGIENTLTIRPWASGGIPGLLSATSTSTPSRSRAVRTAMCPSPAGLPARASIALSSRLVQTWLSALPWT